jgi:hypothetical protein
LFPTLHPHHASPNSLYKDISYYLLVTLYIKLLVLVPSYITLYLELEECLVEKKDIHYYSHCVSPYLKSPTRKHRKEKLKVFKMLAQEKSQKTYPTTAEVRYILQNLHKLRRFSLFHGFHIFYTYHFFIPHIVSIYLHGFFYGSLSLSPVMRQLVNNWHLTGENYNNLPHFCLSK